MEEDGGEARVSGWTRDGDRSIATIVFETDGTYAFSISGEDLAGNPLNDYQSESFILDQMPPQLAILGVEDQSANSGELAPVIRCRDDHYDVESLRIRLSGYQNGESEPTGVSVSLDDGAEFRFSDFPWTQETDDVYTLEADARDLAGNESHTFVRFSVNRFGSVYLLDEATERLAGAEGTYYTDQAQTLTITEINVDTLEFLELRCSLNGSVRVLEEGTDFSLAVSGTDESWKRYVYTIPAETFVEEGHYILSVYSVDRAGGVSDNGTKGKEIAFALDHTAPEILLSGVEDGGRYRESTRSVTLDVQDNVSLSQVELTLNGEQTVYDAATLYETDGRVTLHLGSSPRWQELSVSALDQAGNRSELGTVRFLVTPNAFIQFFMNKRLFYGTILVFLSTGTGAGGFAVWRALKRRKAVL